jgi:hypothetical protein
MRRSDPRTILRNEPHAENLCAGRLRQDDNDTFLVVYSLKSNVNIIKIGGKMPHLPNRNGTHNNAVRPAVHENSQIGGILDVDIREAAVS